jgi:hypothetical protein
VAQAIFLPVFIDEAGVRPSPLLLWTFIGLLYPPRMINDHDCGVE